MSNSQEPEIKTVGDLCNYIDKVILKASDGKGRNISSIKYETYLSKKEAWMSFAIVSLVLVFMFLTLAIYFILPVVFGIKIPALSLALYVIGVIGIGYALNLWLRFCSKKNTEALNEFNKIIDKTVVLDEDILDILYSRIEYLVKIERKPDLTIKEIDALRSRYLKTIDLMKDLNDIEFLNPKEVKGKS